MLKKTFTFIAIGAISVLAENTLPGLSIITLLVGAPLIALVGEK